MQDMLLPNLLSHSHGAHWSRVCVLHQTSLEIKECKVDLGYADKKDHSCRAWTVTLSFGCHCHPASASPLHSMLAWQEGRGAALHGWRESGGDITEGQLGTLWNAAQKPRQEMKGEERCREGKQCEVTFSAFPNPDDKANRSLPANFYPKEPSLLLVHPPTLNKNKGTVLRKADACNL